MTLVLEGKSDPACITALDRNLAELLWQRDAYSQAHELAHQALADIEIRDKVTGTVLRVYEVKLPRISIGANNTGMSNIFHDLLTRVRLRIAEQVISSAGWRMDRSAGAASPNPFYLPAARPTPHLLTWRTRAFAGLTESSWLSSDNAPEASVALTFAAQDIQLGHHEPPRLTSFRLSVDNGRENVRAALLRLLDMLRSMVRLLNGVIRTERLMRLLVRNGLMCRSNALAFVLVILAACRRYGRRSEPDGCTILITRRHLVSMGSCPLT
jgi:hypothetical protein